MVEKSIFYTFLIPLIIIIMIDGIKLVVESLWCSKPHKYSGNHKDVTIIVAAYNEEDVILATIESLSKIVPSRNIIIVDDGSSDMTAKFVRDGAHEVNLKMIHNQGKVNAIHHALEYVETPYILLMDADTQFEPGFIIPTEALEKDIATAVSFNVSPTVIGKSFSNRLLLSFQSHEYAKSMQIGRRFNSFTKSVHCISGAVGLFKTKRLKELSKKHTTIFPGEDLERTLLELVAEGSVIFSENTVYTDVPQTFRQLFKQRIVGWWPGLWRNIGLFFMLIIQRKKPVRLRYELAYEIFAVVTTPLKIISLLGLIIGGQWQLLLFIFCIYFLLEVFVFFRIKKLIGKYMKMEALIVFLYPFYAIAQMFCLMFAFFVFFYKKVLTKEWARIATILLLCIAPLFSQAQQKQEKKKNWSLNHEYSHINDLSKDRAFENHQLYVGFKNIYATIMTEPYNAVNLGGYFGSFVVDTRYQWKSNWLSAKIQYEHWFGSFVPNIMVGYGQFQNVVPSDLEPSEQNPFFIAGVGTSYYFKDDKSNVTLNVIKDFGRKYALTSTLKAKIVVQSFWTAFGGSINNFGNYGAFTQIGYKWFYLNGSYYKNFDFSSFDRTSIGAGLKFKF